MVVENVVGRPFRVTRREQAGDLGVEPAHAQGQHTDQDGQHAGHGQEHPRHGNRPYRLSESPRTPRMIRRTRSQRSLIAASAPSEVGL